MENGVDLDQTVSSIAGWSGFMLFDQAFLYDSLE